MAATTNSLMQWDQIAQLQISTVLWSKLTLTLRAGTCAIGAPILNIIIKASGEKWGFLSINETEVKWLLSTSHDGIPVTLKKKDASGATIRSLSLKYVDVGEAVVSMKSESDGKSSVVDIDWLDFPVFLGALSHLLSRFERMIPSLTIRKSAETVQEDYLDGYDICIEKQVDYQVRMDEVKPSACRKLNFDM
jgi:hypothetical protein